MDSEAAELYTQESQESESEKEKEDKSPPHPKKHKNVKKVRVVKGKECKICRPKKEPSSRNVPYVMKSLTLKKSSMITLNHITNTSFYAVIESVARLGSLESLKKHELYHRAMKLLCQVCRAKFPFASDLSAQQAIHLDEIGCCS